MALEESGIKLVAEGASAFRKALDSAQQDIDALGKATDQTSGQVTSGFAAVVDSAKGLGGGVRKGVDAATSHLSDLLAATQGVGAAFKEADQQAGAAFRAVAAGAATAGLAGVAAVAGTASAALLQAGENAKIIKASLGDLPVDQLQMVDQKASLLASRYGVDLNEAVSAASVLQQEFGLDAATAMDFVVAGFEKGLNKSNDFLDSVGEYSNQFAEMQASPEEFFSALETGLAGGVLGTDKAADAFKEYGIRILDGSETTKQALAELGLDTVMAGIRDGTMSAMEAFPLIQEQLAAIDDPVKQAQLGVALFGTQWEDLGASAMLGIDITKTSLEDLGASSENAFNRIDSLGEIPGRVFGALTTAAMPASEALLDVVNAAMSAGAASDETAAAVANLAVQLGVPAPVAEQLAGAFQATAAYFSGPFQQDLSNGVAVVQGKLEELGNSPFGQTLQRGAAVVASYFANDFQRDLSNGVAVVSATLDELGVDDWWAQVQANAGKIGSYILNEWPQDFANGVNAVVAFVRELPGKISALANDFISSVQGIGRAIIDGIVSGLDKASGGLFSAIRGIISAALGEAKSEADIKSPSGVFAKSIGTPIVEGVAEGITAALHLAGDAGQAIIRTTLDSAAMPPADGEAIGTDAVAHVATGIESGMDGVARAASAIGPTIAKAAYDTVDPRDDLGGGIVAQMALGIEDNLNILREAAAAMGKPFQEEFDQLATSVQAVVEGLYANILEGTAGFVRGQVAALEGLDALRAGTDRASGLSEAEKEAAAITNQLDKLDEKQAKFDADQAKLAQDQAAKRDKLDKDHATKRQAALAIEAKARADLDKAMRTGSAARQRAAQQAYDDARAERVALDGEQADARTALAAEQQAQRTALATRYQGIDDERSQLESEAAAAAASVEAAKARKAELDQIATDAEQRTRDAITASKEIADPRERQLYLDTVTGFIQEEAQYRRDILTAETAEEKARLEERLALVQEAQTIEAEIYARGAEQRLADFQVELEAAQAAAQQLGDFVYYTQEDVRGLGDAAIQGIAAMLQGSLGELGTLISGNLEQSIATARAILGIASPSKVTAEEIGKPMGEGVISGFLASMQGAMHVIGDAARAVVAPVARSVESASSTTTTTHITNVYDYKPTYAREPRNPAQDFAMLRALGGR